MDFHSTQQDTKEKATEQLQNGYAILGEDRESGKTTQVDRVK
jgi:hypothetical protein